MFQVYALAGSVPSSASVAVPLKVMTSPALNSPPSVGVVRMVATGRLPALMLSGVESVELTPSETVSRA